MADFGFDGKVKVSFVATLASTTAPTAVQLTAGTALEGRLTADGLSISSETATVDTSKLNSTAVAQTTGRDTFTISLKYVLGDGAQDVLVQAALVRNAAGFLVVRRGIASATAWTAAQKVEVYPVICGRPSTDDPAPNALQINTIPLFVTDGTLVSGVDNPATVA